MISTKKRIQCFIFALVFALAFSYNCYMDSVNNKVFATSESIAYTSWELFQALMITLGFSVSSTTHTEPTSEELIEEYFGSSYEQWCQAQGEEYEQAMDRNKQLIKDYLDTVSESGACIKQEILSWLPEYVNSEYFHDIISNQASRVVVYDLPNQCNARLDYHFTVNNVPKDLFHENINEWTITSHTAPVYKILTCFYNESLTRGRYGSVLVSSAPFTISDGTAYGNVVPYDGTNCTVYVGGNLTGLYLDYDNISWNLQGDGYVLDMPMDDSIGQSLMFVKWVDELWEDYVGKDVIWSPTTQDVASDVALDWVDALEGVRDVVIPYTDALEDILAKLRALEITWEEAMEAINARTVEREQEGTGEAEEVNPSKPSEEENENTGEEVGENKPIKDVNMQFDLKKLFPFCIPFDVLAFVTVLNADPVAPYFTIPIKIGTFVNYTLTIDFSKFVTLSKILRIGIGIIYICALAVVTSKLIKW